MDLDSPFLKTALIQEKSGKMAEKLVRRGRLNGDVIELEKEDGGLLVLPKGQVVAVLPQLPQQGTAYLQNDVQRALQVLEKAKADFPQRPEVDAKAIADWQRLGAIPTEHDRNQSAALEQWFVECGRVTADSGRDQLEKIQQKGAEFLRNFPDRAEDIERELRGLRELGAVDLKKLESWQVNLGAFGENLAAGMVLWGLLIVPFLVFLKVFPDAIRAFRGGLVLAGMVRLLVAGGALALLWAAMMQGPAGENRSGSPEPTSFAAARKALWFSVNHREKWVNQVPKQITLPFSDWMSFLNGKVGAGSGDDSFPFWHLAKPEMALSKTQLVLFQPVQAKIITLPFRFCFSLPKPGEPLVDMKLVGASVGKIPLGTTVGGGVWWFFQPSYQPLADKTGILEGVRWVAGEGDTVVVEVPETKKAKPPFKESLSAQELAEVFDQGFGDVYTGRVITVEGSLVEVSSIQETLGEGTKLKKQDPMDEFILAGIPEGPGRRYGVRIRCQFKSPQVFFLDSKGDLFQSAPQAQNPESDIPILRRRDGVTRVRISAGRVESAAGETRLVTLYDCRKVEGFDGQKWVPVWAIQKEKN